MFRTALHLLLSDVLLWGSVSAAPRFLMPRSWLQGQ